jgi:hypothetical protein
VNSLQNVLGVQAQAAIGTSMGVLVPQANADYIHEFANSQTLHQRSVLRRQLGQFAQIDLSERRTGPELLQSGHRPRHGVAQRLAAFCEFPRDGGEHSVQQLRRHIWVENRLVV